MKLLNIKAQNFGSYQYLEFDFNNKGLSLIYGPTGAGKSTLQDAVCWTLFGITAKDGSVDDIRSWNNLENPTFSVLSLISFNKIITITRIRGKSGQNDLYWDESGQNDLYSDELGQIHRGKDVQETQRLLEARIGVSSRLYLTGAYFSEFSPTANFFMAKTADKRKILEEIANLSFPVLLGDKFKNELYSIRTKLNEVDNKLQRLEGKLEQAEEQIVREIRDEVSHRRLIEEVKINIKLFEEQRNKDIEELEKIQSKITKRLKLIKKEEPCKECGNIKQNKEQLELNSEASRILYKIEAIKNKPNPDKNTLNLLLSNPRNQDILQSTINKIKNEINIKTNQKLNLSEEYEDIIILQELNLELKGILLQNSVQNIQDNTNTYLEKYFDGALRAEFTIGKLDSLKVDIWKDGNICSYKQLSKGQRGLLKLCFSVSVMKAASNRSGIRFENLFFDEALDGLDNDLKLKSFNLFQELELENDSILLIDHCEEFKGLFDKKFKVTLESGNSTLQETK